MEKKLSVDAYIGFNGSVDNNLILIRKEKQIDNKTLKEKLKSIEKEEMLENEKKKQLKKVYNLKNIEVNHNYYELQKEELKYHYFMIYVIGTNIVKEDIGNNERVIFKHNNHKITKLYVDNQNKYICCCTESKLQSDICIFDFENKNKPIILSLHKIKTIDISISNDAKYLLSSGGDDDKQLILTEIKTQKFVYKAVLSTPYTCVRFFHKTNNFIIAKMNSIKICYYDFTKRLMSEEDVNISIYKRQFVCLELKENDEYAYVGTTTGDIFVINVKAKILEKIVPDVHLFGNGINVIKIVDDNTILTGSGDGFLSLINLNDRRIEKKQKLYGSISSIQMRNESTLFVGVKENVVYVVDLPSNTHYVLLLQPNSHVSDLCFPFQCNDVMFTCSFNSIMAWNFYNKKALYLKNIDHGNFIYYDTKFLRKPEVKMKRGCVAHTKLTEIKTKKEEIQKKKKTEEKFKNINKKLDCHSINITTDGKYIALSIDCNIYLLTPKYMKTVTVIFNAHYEFCNVLTFHNTYDLISAGNKGDIKLWKFHDNKYVLVNSIHNHSGTINQILLHNETNLCSCSQDGLITIYNIKENVLKKRIIDINHIKYTQIALNKKYEILLCAGNNNVLMYYDLIDNTISKHFYYSPYHNVQYIDIEESGKYFITGSDDYKLRLYDFLSCTCLYIGTAHNSIITKCVFTFDGYYIVSASKDESIIYWKVPQEIKEKSE